MKIRIPSTVVVLALAGAFTAAAQEGDAPKPPRERRGPPPEMLEKFDKDGDGKLNKEERQAAMEARRERGKKMREKMLERFDADGDGKLNEEERKAAREAMEARRKEMLKKYDTDGDGRLSPEERKAAIDAGENIPPQPMRRPGAGPDRPGRNPADRPGDRPGRNPADRPGPGPQRERKAPKAPKAPDA